MNEKRVGSILDGKYEVLERLGGGGMGDIYLVRHLHLEQKRIVKILRPELAADSDAQKRFLREARLATQIKHPNVAILYDYSQMEDESFYMVWEHIDGDDVGRWLEAKKVFPIPLALQLGIQALRGLEAIHVAGVIHRDISPDNLMITHDRRGRHLLKIIDLGLAKGLTHDPRHEVTQAGSFMGKLRYCSPEQAGSLDEGTLDHRSDIYSFALVLYEMIVGESPFEAENSPGSVFKRLTEEPRSMIGLNPRVDVPSELDAVIRKALSRDREARYDHAIAFIEALEPLLEGFGGRPAVAAPAASGAESATRRPGSLISKEERAELLAQIDRAARRMKRTGQLLRAAEEAARGGDLEQGRRLAAQVEAQHPQATGLHELKKLLAELARDDASSPDGDEARIDAATTPLDLVALDPGPPQAEPASAASAVEPPPAAEAGDLDAAAAAAPSPPPSEPESETGAAEDEARIAARTPAQGEGASITEAEALVERYLKERKTILAGLALETLIELKPDHPRRNDFEEWVRLIRDEEQQRERAERAVEAGRAALERGDLKAARRQLEVAAKNDPSGELADELMAEIEETEEVETHTQEFSVYSATFEEALAKGELDEAERIYEKLSDIEVAKVTLTLYRNRLDAARSRERDRELVAAFEQRIAERLAEKDWKGAREVVHELSEALPESPLPAELLADVDQREQDDSRRRSVVYGAQQVEEFLATGDRDGASLALRILRQMDPENPNWERLEARLESLDG